MSQLDRWFPYSSYRPGQEDMLNCASSTAKSGGVLLIDAPTGSGKSSVVSALLAERGNRMVIVTVRTISQLATYVRELDLVRKKQPALKYSYLVGKNSMCPLGGFGDVYRKCEAVKAFSTSLIKERADRGSLDPSRDPYIIQQIKKNDPDHPLICPYYIRSRTAVYSEKAGSIKLIPSESCRKKAELICTKGLEPKQIESACESLCPYEVMMHASQQVDLLIVNYHHLLDDQIREQLYLNLQREPGEIMLLIDEAHNCGDVVQDIQSVHVDQQMLEAAEREIGTLRKDMKNLDAVRHLIPRVRTFMDGLKRSMETEDWFDPAIFTRMILRESFYTSLEEVVGELMDVSEAVKEASSKRGDYKTTGIEQLTGFLYRLNLSLKNPAYLTVYHKDKDAISLEARSIDPAPAISEIAKEHSCMVLISGTLTPLSSYQQLYFRNLPDTIPVTHFSLPNAFPRKNRLLIGASDITSAYSMRQNADHNDRIAGYIRTFAGAPGNLAVYFPSYQVLESIVREVEIHIKKEVFIEPKESSEAGELLSRFMNLPKAGKSGILFAVCGGKFSEGLDYRGDMLTGALVIGLPLAPWNRVRQMIMDYYTQRYGEEGKFLAYTLPALNKVQQALGRVLRTPEDTGILIFGEKRFLEDQIRTRLPDWMQEELISCTYDQFSDLIRKWR
ncbi:MAG TPA: ATP-dependent DNA helicase [Methanospirillum sp.]|nr:ATP-dependent DNA helicase [Methanospirillum sp.]